jgi:hypothetical protein
MRTTRRALCAISITIASILALSCNNAYGVFQSVQLEKKQVGTSVFQETTVYNVFRLNGYYYAATASLNRTPVGEDSWSTLPINGSTAYSLRSAVLAGSTIYVLIETGIEPNSTISVYSSTDGNTWGAPLSSQPGYSSPMNNYDALFATSDGNVYAENHSYDPNPTDPTNPGNSIYTLYYFNGSVFVQATGVIPGTNMTIRGVVWDNTNYWFASEDKLYTGDKTGVMCSSVTSSGPFAGMNGTIWGISISSSNNLYVTTKNGYIYRNDEKSANPVGLPLTQVVEVPSAAGQILLVGTDAIPPTSVISSAPAQGYYECNVGTFPNGFVSGGSGVVDSNSSIYSTTVSIAPVHSFFYDGDATSGRLFVCVSPGTSSTSYYGLYESDWNGTSWSGWAAR